MIETTTKMRCNKCGKVIEEVWLRSLWKGGEDSHLCKECTKLFNQWLKEKPKEESRIISEEKAQVYEKIDGKWIPIYEEDGSPARALIRKCTNGITIYEGLTPTAKRKIKEMAKESKRKLSWVVE